MQAVQLAYLAGLFDGEGCFRIQKSFTENDRATHKVTNPVYHAQLVIGMVDKDAVSMFSEVFGQGYVREERVPNRRSIWRWALTGRHNIQFVVEALLPYLRVKRPQALTVLDFVTGWRTPYNRRLGTDPEEIQRREEAYQTVRKLNAVGAAATTEYESTREGEATV